MTSDAEKDKHVQKAYEAALYKREQRQLLEAYLRYKRNVRAAVSTGGTPSDDFEGCIE